MVIVSLDIYEFTLIIIMVIYYILSRDIFIFVCSDHIGINVYKPNIYKKNIYNYILYKLFIWFGFLVYVPFIRKIVVGKLQYRVDLKRYNEIIEYIKTTDTKMFNEELVLLNRKLTIRKLKKSKK